MGEFNFKTIVHDYLFLTFKFLIMINEKDILVFQPNKGELEIHTGLTQRKLTSFLKERVPSSIENFQRMEARVKAIHQSISNPDFVTEYFMFKSAQAEADKLLNLDLANREEVAIKEKRIDEYHRYTSIGSVLLYKHTNYQGSSRFLTITFPDLKVPPLCFNDKASSSKSWGLNVLFEHTWYRGRKVFLISGKDKALNIPDYRRFGFNDKVSSYISF